VPNHAQDTHTDATTCPAGRERHTTREPEPPTRARRVAKATKACHAKRGRKRAVCEATAHRKFSPTKKGKS
jgi:hypothetical protein